MCLSDGSGTYPKPGLFRVLEVALTNGLKGKLKKANFFIWQKLKKNFV